MLLRQIQETNLQIRARRRHSSGNKWQSHNLRDSDSLIAVLERQLCARRDVIFVHITKSNRAVKREASSDAGKMTGLSVLGCEKRRPRGGKFNLVGCLDNQPGEASCRLPSPVNARHNL